MPDAQLPGGGGPVFASTGPHGHRGRMRERLLTRGPETLADYEILEMLLFYGFAKGDTKPLAKALINRFGSLSAVLSAPAEALARAGVTAEAVTALHMPPLVAKLQAAAETRIRPVLSNWDALLTYFDTALAGAVPGQLRLLMLDNRNRLLGDEVIEDDPAGLPQRVAARALTLHATALILVRVARPGPVDKATLKREAVLCAQIAAPVAALSIIVHDHMLIGSGHWISLRQKGLL